MKPRSCTSIPVKISDGSLQTSSLAQRQRFGRELYFDLLLRFHFICKKVIIAKRPADRKLVRNSAAFQFRLLLRGSSTATEKTSTVSAGPRRFFKRRYDGKQSHIDLIPSDMTACLQFVIQSVKLCVTDIHEYAGNSRTQERKQQQTHRERSVCKNEL